VNVEEEITQLKNEMIDIRIRTTVNENNIKTVTDSVKEIKQNTSKLVWLVGSALVLTILNVIIKGGLKI
jgi:hypothetical protein